jgi:transcriptional repressor NrdR
MQCPFCGDDNDKVVDSRSSDGARAVRRRRECLHCNRRFTTYERADETPRITVVKKDGSRVPFDRQKVLAGLQKACYKRPVSDEQLHAIVETAEEEIFGTYDKEVPSTFIGDVISKHLQKVDKVAFIRFASVYREFADVGELIEKAQEVRDLPGDNPAQRDLFQGPTSAPDQAENKTDQ